MAAARCPTYVGEPRWSSTTCSSSRSRPSRSIVRTKLCPVAPNSHDERTIQPSRTAALARELRSPVDGERARLVGLDVRRALRRRRRRSRSSSRRPVRRATRRSRVPATFTRRAPVRIGLGSVDVGPGRRVQAPCNTVLQGRTGVVGTRPSRTWPGRAHVERVEERAAELAGSAGDDNACRGAAYDDASRADRIGDRVLHRSTTRGSSQGISCSSGSDGSYSSVTW